MYRLTLGIAIPGGKAWDNMHRSHESTTVGDLVACTTGDPYKSVHHLDSPYGGLTVSRRKRIRLSSMHFPVLMCHVC